MLAGVIIYNWVFNSANGSVLIIMMMHAMNNTVSATSSLRCSQGPTR
jgi:hypothetical protein